MAEELKSPTIEVPAKELMLAGDLHQVAVLRAEILLFTVVVIEVAHELKARGAVTSGTLDFGYQGRDPAVTQWMIEQLPSTPLP